MEEKETKKVIDIYPSRVRRRVLAFLADIFVSTILSIILFELVVFQIARPIINFDGLVSKNEEYQEKIYDLLYDYEILYFDYDENENISKYTLSSALEDTYYHYVNYLVNDEDESLVKYEVFYKYFVDIKENGDVEEVNSLYKQYALKYFDTSKTTSLGTYPLKDEYKEEFKHNYVEDDEMSIQGYEDYNSFLNDSFLHLYNEIFNDIKENDLTSKDGTYTYSFIRNSIDEMDKTINNVYIICSYIAFLISNIILFLIYPMFNERRGSLGERILKLERISRKNMEYISRGMVINIFLLKMIDSLCLLFFIPVLRIGFAYIFALPILYLPSLIAIIIALINLAITLVTKLNTSLKEITTDSIVVDSDSLNKYYEEIS